MGSVELALGVIGAVATVIATAIQVRDRLSRRRAPAAAPPTVEPPAAPGGGYDAFVSYARADTRTARALATRLHAEGLRVFLAEWIGPGLVETLEKETALRTTANGILVFSGTTMNDAAIRDEYAALLRRVHSGGRRFIPVLVDDVDLPPFAEIRRPVDLRSPGSAPYDQNLTALVRALQPRSDAT
ncbi:toll/interleukin-1 receptor domain-containing protein [Streptomyces alfalfae]